MQGKFIKTRDRYEQNTLEGAISSTGRGVLLLTVRELCHSQQEHPPCPPRAPGLWGPHTESGPAVCVLPKQVFKAKLAQHQPSGLPPVPPWVFRDQLQFMILASYSDFVAMCSKTAQLCNLSWKILCLRRPSVHSVSFPEGYFIPATNHILKTLTITKMTNLPFSESLVCVSYHTNLNSLSN